ncbi:MAG TPA: hypothetical protein VFT45_01385 [Longimicrobium sp.]|nr:hypothetical protein [Longimicrobium sp.]
MMMLIRRTALVLTLISISGCMHWKQVRPLPSAEEAPVSLRSARLTTGGMEEGRMRVAGLVLLRDVQITGDSVIGWAQGAGDRVAVPRNQVSSLESRGIDTLRTAGVTTLVVLLAYGAAAWYALAHVKV